MELISSEASVKEAYILPTALETLSPDYWWTKFVMAPICLCLAYGSFSKKLPLSGLVSVIFLALGFLLLSLTRIKPENEAVKYRRFFQWRALSYSEITGCGDFWVLGFVRAKQRIFPWGSIWFVLPRNRRDAWRWDFGVISFIRSKAGLSEPS